MYDDFKKRLVEKQTLIQSLKDDKKLLSDKEQELKDCIELISDYKLAYMQLDDIIEKSNNKFIEKIERLLNKAISTIFYDENYSIKLLVENKKLDIQLIDNNNVDKDGNPLKTDLEDACGGGVITVIGFTLQLFIIEVLGLNKTIFIDEGFMALSDKYRPILYDFINEFCKTANMKILLISHDELAKEKAVKEFVIEHGNIK